MDPGSGVRPARLHDARHTAATTLLIMGVPARVVMQILGHSQIGLTLGTYSHVVPELATEAANRMAKAYWSELMRPQAFGRPKGSIATTVAPSILCQRRRLDIVAGQEGPPGRT